MALKLGGRAFIYVDARGYVANPDRKHEAGVKLVPVTVIMQYYDNANPSPNDPSTESYIIFDNKTPGVGNFDKNDWTPDAYYKIVSDADKYHGKPGRWVRTKNLCEDRSGLNDGCSCEKCREFVPMAESNQSNGTFVCYSCRMNPFR
jgi:hypothetical protein